MQIWAWPWQTWAWVWAWTPVKRITKKKMKWPGFVTPCQMYLKEESSKTGSKKILTCKPLSSFGRDTKPKMSCLPLRKLRCSLFTRSWSSLGGSLERTNSAKSSHSISFRQVHSITMSWKSSSSTLSTCSDSEMMISQSTWNRKKMTTLYCSRDWSM